jgi:RNA polymerase sigma factor (sigma-70 family)
LTSQPGRKSIQFLEGSACGRRATGYAERVGVSPAVPTDSAEISALVRAAAVGERKAWDALVDRFGELIWAVARGLGLSKADAADVCQTTWLRLAEHVGRLREPDRVGGWLATTARNEALRTLKRSARQVPTDWDDPARIRGYDEPPPDQRLLDDERNAALWRAFDGLSGPCKVLLRYLIVEPPPTYAEVSAVLDIPTGTIGPRRNRCLDNLRRSSAVCGQQGALAP